MLISSRIIPPCWKALSIPLISDVNELPRLTRILYLIYAVPKERRQPILGSWLCRRLFDAFLNQNILLWRVAIMLFDPYLMPHVIRETQEVIPSTVQHMVSISHI